MCAWRRNSCIQFPTHKCFQRRHYKLAPLGPRRSQLGDGEGSSEDPASPSPAGSRPHWTVLQRLCLGSELAATVPESHVRWPFSQQNKPPPAIICRLQETVENPNLDPHCLGWNPGCATHECVTLRCHFTSLFLSFPTSFLGLL